MPPLPQASPHPMRPPRRRLFLRVTHLRCLAVLLPLLVLALPRRAHADPDPYLATGLDAAGSVVSIGGLALGVEIMGHSHQGYLGVPVLIASTAALLIAPSAGHIYAGEWFSTGMDLRGIGLGAVALGGVFAIVQCPGGHDAAATGGGCDLRTAAVLAGAGVLTIATGIGWDLVTAHAAGESSGPALPHLLSIGVSF